MLNFITCAAKHSCGCCWYWLGQFFTLKSKYWSLETPVPRIHPLSKYSLYFPTNEVACQYIASAIVSSLTCKIFYISHRQNAMKKYSVKCSEGGLDTEELFIIQTKWRKEKNPPLLLILLVSVHSFVMRKQYWESRLFSLDEVLRATPSPWDSSNNLVPLKML